MSCLANLSSWDCAMPQATTNLGHAVPPVDKFSVDAWFCCAHSLKHLRFFGATFDKQFNSLLSFIGESKFFGPDSFPSLGRIDLRGCQQERTWTGKSCKKHNWLFIDVNFRFVYTTAWMDRAPNACSDKQIHSRGYGHHVHSLDSDRDPFRRSGLYKGG